MKSIRETKARRSQSGQSMVEYAIGIGAVAALCMVALGVLGHICGDMIRNVQDALNYNGQKATHQGFTVNPSATPWVLD
ncbi:MAG: hypothetical protein KC777_01590 [Cyanobacteria bacterium HKST-UBA02]|nr:hypothetical protein [Cyanobacteria bacterium HKST-UBA02]